MGRQAQILIVEDDFLVAERMRQVLNEAGYAVTGVTRRTATARDIVERGNIDLVIVGMMLEVDVDGVRTATALHSLYGVRILITTGFPDHFVRQQMQDTAACDILRKPFSDRELLTAVEACCAKPAAPPPRH